MYLSSKFKKIATLLLTVVVLATSFAFYPTTVRAQPVAGAAGAVGGGIASCVVTNLLSAFGGGLTDFLPLGQEVPVKERSLRTKESCLDAIAWSVAKFLLTTITFSVIDWINHGFNGSPAFISNPVGFLGDVAEEVSGIFIQELGLTQLCSLSWRRLITISLTLPNPYWKRSQCTISDVVGNIDEFFEDSAKAGWDGWLEVTINSQNNPYGLYNLSSAELESRQQAKKKEEENKLTWGQGFHSIVEKTNECAREVNGTCIEYKYDIVTPGKWINTQLSETTSSNIRTIEQADELQELIPALVSQLIVSLFESGLSNFGG